jgi:hypothetical protein
MGNIERRLSCLEVAVLAAKRSTAEGLIALLDRGQLTMQQLTDQELERIVDPAWQPVMDQLTENELNAIISGIEKANNDNALLADPAWVAAHQTEDEQAAIRRYVELAEKAGLAWAG